MKQMTRADLLKEIERLQGRIAELDSKQRGRKLDGNEPEMRNELYRTAIQTSLDGFWINDMEGRFLDVNDEYCRIIGYSREELLRMRISDVEAVEKPNETAHHIEKVLHKEYERFETRHRRKDGMIADIEISATYSAAAGGQFMVFVRDITERKRVEEERFAALARFSGFAAASQYGMGMADLDGRITFVNATLVHMLGEKTAEDCLGKHFPTAYYTPSMAKKLQEEVLPALMDVGHWHGELEIRTADGRSVPTEENYFVVRDEQGRIRYLADILTDITERKKTELQLLLSSQIVHNIQVGLHIYKMEDLQDDRTLRMVFANPASAELTGVAVEDVIGKTLDENFPFLRERGIPQRYAEVVRTHQPFALDDIYYGDNRVINGVFSIKAFPLPDNQVGILFENITGRKKVEEALRRFERAVETSTDAIGMSTPDGKHYYQNKAFDDLFGEIGDKPPSAIFVNEAVGREVFKTIMSGAEWNGEVQMHGKSGKTLDIMLRAYPMKDEQGAVIGLVGVHTDITKQRGMEAQFRQAQKMESIGRLAGGVAHDFNNMLTLINGYGEMVFRKLRPKDPLREDVKQIIEAARRSAALTRQLLAFSRRQTLRPEVLDLNTVVANLDKMLRRLIREDIEFKTVLADNLSPVEADPGQVDQVIVNLAVNARDAMPRGGKLTIETANVEIDSAYAANHVSMVPGRYVMLAISDTGWGMDEETKSNIFEPFFTTKEKGKGTGLGLSTVYGIVKQSGGNILVYSEPGQGTTFRIYLPQTQAIQEPAAEKPEAAGPAAGGENILVVEDEEAIRDLIGSLLSELGYTATLAANGGEALLLVEEKGLRPDMVITDVVMPGMNGKELIDRLRRNWPHLKVLYMSGYTDNAIVHHGVLDPGTPFIEKPFSIHNLGKKIREVLERNSP